MDPLILTNNGKGRRLNCTAVSSSVSVKSLVGDSLVVTNPNSFDIYLAVGGPSIEADLTSYLILPGEKEDNLVIDPNADYAADPWVAVICATGLAGPVLVHRASR